MPQPVQLITYVDRLAGDFSSLASTIRDAFGDAYGGVHLLPFFTPFDGADAGFDPMDHTQVDPRLGTWADVGALSAQYGTVVDVIVNHMSADSSQFQDYVAHGEQSPYADLFLTMSSVFPDGATEQDLAAIYRPRPGLPFTPMLIGGQPRLVWTSFTAQQIDIDVHSVAGRDYLNTILDTLAEAGVSMIRLDAAGYAVKTAGTSCFMTDESFAFIADFSQRARERGLQVLVEVHSYYQKQVEIARKVDLVYDFALPPLVLHALYNGNGAALQQWFQVRPVNAITVLDTHDGIGIIDAGPSAPDLLTGERLPGLLTDAEVDALVQQIHQHTHGESAQATGAAASNLDLYQVNTTFYDALGQDDRRYLAARAIQFFAPGTPQVYYVGALVGTNDMELLKQTGVGRDINRHYYTPAEIHAATQQPVTQALTALARFRSTFSAFDGAFTSEVSSSGDILTMRWAKETDHCALTVHLPSAQTEISWSTAEAFGRTDDLVKHPVSL